MINTLSAHGSLTIALFCSATAIPLDAQVFAACNPGIVYARSPSGTFVLIDDNVEAAKSTGRLELVVDGEIMWSVATRRRCTDGSLACQLSIPYSIDDGTVGEIMVDVLFGALMTDSGNEICIWTMWQLGQELAHLYRRYNDEVVTFQQGHPDAPIFQMVDFLGGVPSVFQGCGCKIESVEL